MPANIFAVATLALLGFLGALLADLLRCGLLASGLAELHVGSEGVAEHFVRSIVAVDAADDGLAVLAEHLGGGFLVHLEAVLDDGFVGVVLAAFDLGAVQEAGHDGLFVLDVEHEDVLHVDDGFDELDLSDSARNTVEEEGVLIRVDLVRVHEAFDEAAENFDGGFVRNEEALAGVRSKELAGFAGRSNATEDVARGNVLEGSGSSELCTDGTLAGTGSAKDKDCRNFSHC